MICQNNKRNRSKQKSEFASSFCKSENLVKYLTMNGKSIKLGGNKTKCNSFDYENYEKDYNDQNNDLQQKISNIDIEIQKIESSIIELEKNISNMNGQMVNFRDCEFDRDEINDEIDSNNERKIKLEEDNVILDNELKILNNSKKEKELELNKYDNVEKEKQEHEKNKKNKIIELQKKIDLLRSEIVNDNNLKGNILDCEKNIKNNKIELKHVMEYIAHDEKKLSLFSLDGIISACDKYIKYSNDEIKNTIVNEIIDNINEYKFKNKNELIDEIKKKSVNIDESTKNDYLEIKNENDINSVYGKLAKNIKVNQEKKGEIERIILFNENRIKNINTNKEISILEKELNDVKNKIFDKYDKYVELNNVINNINANIKNTEQQKKNNMINLEKVKIIIKHESDKLSRATDNYEQKQKFNKYRDEIDKAKRNLDMLRKDKKNKINTHSTMQKNMNENFYMFGQNKVKIEQYKTCIEEIAMYEKLILIFGNYLIPTILKEKIIPKIEKTTNLLLTSAGFESIKIVYDKTIEIKRYGKDISIKTEGKFYSNLYDLAFRIGLSQINQFVKQN